MICKHKSHRLTINVNGCTNKLLFARFSATIQKREDADDGFSALNYAVGDQSMRYFSNALKKARMRSIFPALHVYLPN